MLKLHLIICQIMLNVLQSTRYTIWAHIFSCLYYIYSCVKLTSDKDLSKVKFCMLWWVKAGASDLHQCDFGSFKWRNFKTIPHQFQLLKYKQKMKSPCKDILLPHTKTMDEKINKVPVGGNPQWMIIFWHWNGLRFKQNLGPRT